MALKKLKTFAFAALLLLAGSAQLSASKGGAAELSPNLHIVTKSQKADKKNDPGFMAFLKKSAKGLGQTFVAAVNTHNHNAPKIAQKSPARRALTMAKMTKKSDVRVALPATCLQPAFFAAMDFHSNSEPAQLVKGCAETVYILLFDAKTGSLPPPVLAAPAKIAIFAGLKEDYSLMRSIWNLFKPGVSIKPARSPHAQRQLFASMAANLYAPAGTGRPQRMPVIDTLALATPKTAGLCGGAQNTPRGRNHLTIDPAQAAELLTDGTMGARSALRSHRSRDHWSQSV